MGEEQAETRVLPVGAAASHFFCSQILRKCIVSVYDVLALSFALCATSIPSLPLHRHGTTVTCMLQVDLLPVL